MVTTRLYAKGEFHSVIHDTQLKSPLHPSLHNKSKLGNAAALYVYSENYSFVLFIIHMNFPYFSDVLS